MSVELSEHTKRLMREYERVYAEVHQGYIANLSQMRCIVDRDGLRMGNKRVMYYSERGLMHRHAELLLAGKEKKDLLEIGYGLGVFAEEAYHCGAGSHTIIEAHPVLVERAMEWRKSLEHPERVNVIHSSWQEAFPLLERYDAIMYDGGSPGGYAELDFRYLVEVLCLARLRSGGRFSFWSYGAAMEPSRERILHAHFGAVDTYPFRMEPVPETWTRESADFTVVVARK